MSRKAKKLLIKGVLGYIKKTLKDIGKTLKNARGVGNMLESCYAMCGKKLIVNVK
jgi:hypothetical protein